MRKTGLAIVAAAVIAVPAFAEADQTFSGAGQRNTLDCDGGSLRVEGASNELSIAGGCTALEVEGASNIIQVDMAPGGTITLVGASNRIRWSAPKGAKVKVQATGAGNQVLRAN
ncbi:hypothetical protein FHS96_000291 [Sphingomonas zeicaulis]|uniref:DUF3060 domain-containing protein n=1 Tax=Sphingomonas zeicaulis TaxID=1632740 RepID=UPI003D1CC39F